MLISALRAWLQPTQPSPIDALIYETIPQIIVSFLLCLAIDHALVSKLGLGKARWFSLHTIVNAIVCILAAEDTLSTLLDPIHACEGPVSTLAISLVISLHAYHSSTQSTAEMYAGGILPRNLSKRSLSTLARNLSRESLLRLAEAN
ncbi:hypothetical protein T492DRAFT_833965 [Pavlovales sp. CCMP2436]|nr:hypothetical protein T492DRAFT_833965 [Pavlovales sp. CCMP2436]